MICLNLKSIYSFNKLTKTGHGWNSLFHVKRFLHAYVMIILYRTLVPFNFFILACSDHLTCFSRRFSCMLRNDLLLQTAFRTRHKQLQLVSPNINKINEVHAWQVPWIHHCIHPQGGSVLRIIIKLFMFLFLLARAVTTTSKQAFNEKSLLEASYFLPAS